MCPSFRAPHWLVPLLALAGPVAALAGEGVVEINQVRALAGGINDSLADDPPGFPVVIRQTGSYLLTGNLTGFSENTDAIVVQADDVTIDLNGFGLIGRGVTGTGVGIEVAQGFARAVIRNGFVRDVGDVGVSAGENARVEGVVASGCGTEGIFAAPGGLVRGNEVVGNGSFGMVLGSDTGYVDNVLRGNAAPGVQGGVSLGGNLCDGALCSSPPQRRFYLTQAAVPGGQAALLGTCAAGFHFASLWEILDPSALTYHAALGVTRADSGSGPPSPSSAMELLPFSAVGWVRTGSVSDSTSGQAGQTNCNAWASSSLSAQGTTAQLRPEWTASPIRISPWTTESRTCDNSIRVWCVQD